MTLPELIAALEQATGPSRKLDAEIDCLVRFTNLRPSEPDDFAGKYGYRSGDIKSEHGFLQASFYTSSIDAALTLVPEGLGRGAFSLSVDSNGKAGCTVWTNAEFNRYVNSGTTHNVTKRPPAIALCIAALKARGTR